MINAIKNNFFSTFNIKNKYFKDILKLHSNKAIRKVFVIHYHRVYQNYFILQRQRDLKVQTQHEIMPSSVAECTSFLNYHCPSNCPLSTHQCILTFKSVTLQNAVIHNMYLPSMKKNQVHMSNSEIKIISFNANSRAYPI